MKQKPTPHQTAMLRRISVGSMLVTMVRGKPVYSYEDGTEIRDQDDAIRLIARKWVVPSSAPMFGEIAQNYIVPHV